MIPKWLHWLDSCPSTNTWAQENSNLGHGEVVFTPLQTAGKGQHGRIWYAPKGVFTASFILEIPVEKLSGLSLVAGLAVIYALEDLIYNLQNQLRLKWPNDIWIDGQKLGGILCEGSINSSGNKARIIVGVGLNISADFQQIDIDKDKDNQTIKTIDKTVLKKAISLHQVVDTIPSELMLLESIRTYLLQMASLFSIDKTGEIDKIEKSIGKSDTPLTMLLQKIRDRDGLYGRKIGINTSEKEIWGKAAGIDDKGYLLLKLEDGTLQAFSSGSVIINH
jgi:BirA family transcriptional regulator, biotin operon repressor / biotin---[acetyl-CoA-carboxylase] ligase